VDLYKFADDTKVLALSIIKAISKQQASAKRLYESICLDGATTYQAANITLAAVRT
jgi:hypothetical protein